jgi:hypothetical protein
MSKPADAGDREREAAIDALYQGSLDQFTAGRNALAASLKKSGDKASAERVKALAKPSSTAWAVNQAWWRHRERFQAMLDAGAAQRRAHIAFAQGKQGDVRAAGEARRQAVSEVTEAALDALGGHKAVAPDVQYRIAGTVEALASSGVPDGESPGRLTRDLQSSGLDALTALAEAAGSVPRPTIVARGTPAESTPPRAKPEATPGETARERKAREAEEATDRARVSQLAQARERIAELSSASKAAARAADEAAAEEASARAALEAATKRRVDLEAALDDARADEAASRRALSSATAAASRSELDRARADRDAARAREALGRLEGGK